MRIMTLAATLALLLSPVSVSAQEKAPRSDREASALRAARDDYFREFRDKVVLLRRLHVPGERTTWAQYGIYQQLLDAVKNQGLQLESLGTTRAELRALVWGGSLT